MGLDNASDSRSLRPIFWPPEQAAGQRVRQGTIARHARDRRLPIDRLSLKVARDDVLPNWGVPVALIALVGASETLPDGGLRALVTIAGEALIERQAARLADVGVTHIAVAVAAVPAELLAICDRIRRRGIKVTAVRSAADLAMLVGEGDRLLLVADGLRAGATHYGAIARPGTPAILVTGDTVLTQGFERIDATRRWGGLACISDAMVRDLDAMPGDWDMLLTLLRLAVQADARRLYCEPAVFEQGEIAIITDRPTAALIEQSSLQQVEYGGMGLGRSLVMMPLVRLAGPLLVRSPSTARHLPYAAATLWITAALLAAGGLAAAAAFAAIGGGLALAAMRFLGAFRAKGARQERVSDIIRSASLVLLAVFPVLVARAGPAPQSIRVDEAVLAPSLVAAILLSRTLFEDRGETRRLHWLLPDADQAWLMLAPAILLGVLPHMLAALPLIALLQILAWIRLARRPKSS